MRARLLHCMRVRLHNGYTQAYVHIMQHIYTHKAVTGRVEAKKLLSHRRQSNYRCVCLCSNAWVELKHTTCDVPVYLLHLGCIQIFSCVSSLINNVNQAAYLGLIKVLIYRSSTEGKISILSAGVGFFQISGFFELPPDFFFS